LLENAPKKIHYKKKNKKQKGEIMGVATSRIEDADTEYPIHIRYEYRQKPL